MDRRRFLGSAAAAAAGAALGSLLPSVPSWATPLKGEKIRLKIRQDIIGDRIMDMMISGFNERNKDVSVKSSYVKSDLGWNYEIEHAGEAPFWYTEGEQCQLFLGRGPALGQLADAGVIMPLDELLDKSETLKRDDFHRSKYGGILDSATYRGKLWGIPFSGDTYALFRNVDLFRAAGLERTPVTWDETIDFAKKMTRDTNGDGKPDVFGYSQCSFQFPLQLLSAGVDLVDLKNKCVHFDSEEAVEALDIYRRLVEWSPEHVDFEKGDMGMKISVTTNAHGRYNKINYVTDGLPAGKRRANTYGDSDGIFALTISALASADEQAAAMRFIEFITGEKMFFKISDATKMIPIRRSIIEGERYAKYLEKNPQIKAFVSELEYAVPKPCIPEYRFIEVVMREILYPVQEEGRAPLTRAQMLEHLKVQNARVNERLLKSNW